MTQSLAPIWSSDDFTESFSVSVLNGAIPIFVALGVAVSTRNKTRIPSSLHKPRRSESGHAEPIQLVLDNESRSIYQKASSILASDPHVNVPRPRNLKNLADLLCSLALTALHAYGMTRPEFERNHFFWFLAWLCGSAVCLRGLEERRPFWWQKLFLSLIYVSVTLFNLRTDILIHVPSASYLAATQLFFGTTILSLAMFVPSTPALPSDLVQLYREYPVAGSAQEAQDIPPPPNYYITPWSRATFGYMTHFIWKHYWTPVKINSVPEILPPFRTACVLASSRKAERDAKKASSTREKTQQSLYMKLWRTIGSKVMVQWLLQLIRAGFRIGQIFMLSSLLSYAENRDEAIRNHQHYLPIHVGYFFAVMLFLCQMSDFFLDVNTLQYARENCSQARSLIVGEIISKTLRRRSNYVTSSSSTEASSSETDDGRIFNLMSVDTMKIEALIAMSHTPAVEYPLTILFCAVLLYQLLGNAAIAGILIMFISTPIQTQLSKRMLVVQDMLLQATDNRLRLANEVLSCVKIVKFFAWEAPFAQRMKQTRDTELRLLTIDNFINVLSSLLFVGMPMLVTLASFGIYTQVLGEALTAQKAFTALSIFNTLRVPLSDLPDVIVATLNSWISIRRVDSYMRSADTLKYDQFFHADESQNQIGFSEATFCYAQRDTTQLPDDRQQAAPKFQLENISCQFPLNELSLIVGPVGSGKSSMLLALLGELQCVSGKLLMPRSFMEGGCQGIFGSIAFCPQNAWILNDTVRNNILFGHDYHETRYRQVLHACSLDTDLDSLEYHDATEVGEKGTSLSGGQKARIALARAFYSEAKVILIDDALSAVDAHTAHHLVEQCLKGELAQDRTVILATHAVSLVQKQAAFAAVMESGQVIAQGTPSELSANKFLVEEADTAGSSAPPEFYESDVQADKQWAATQTKRDQKSLSAHAENIHRQMRGSDLYLDYLRAVAQKPTLAITLWIGMLALYIAVRSADVGSTAWLREWANSYSPSPNPHSDVAPSKQSSEYYLMRYVLLVLIFVAFSGARDVYQFDLTMRASRNLYSRLIESLMNAPPRFFDVTPIGRIMNRLAKDTQTVDTEIRPSFKMLSEAIVTLIAILTVICWATPQFLYLAVFVLGIYYVIGAAYLASSRDLKRIESVQRSPLYTLLGETLAGTVTIRAYGHTQRIVAQCMDLIDNSTRAYLCLWSENRWVAIRVQTMGALVTLITALLLLYTGVDAALMGFTLSYAVLIMTIILRIVRRYTMLEITLNSVERMKEYIQIPSEHQGGKQPPAHWPTDTGGIQVNQLCVRYAPEYPLALSNVSVDIKPGEKVGIVGRTGSGKSTFALSFFRFVEAASGSIVVDGIDISTITLESLRRRITIIPQDAQLFKGTIRLNLDPFNLYDDAEMWNALYRCQLVSRSQSTGSDPAASNDTISSLDDIVEQGGSNFSAGQCQLISLARGLLKMRDSRILILDESTANLDSESDALIQKTIRDQITSNTTLITVAHRLKTVIDYDKVLVLDHGRVLEFDSPANLLADRTSEFYSLCSRSGELQALTDAANKAHPPT
ncbi:hypothetical protein MPSI1_001349 [Malassezia psittaci]|uniref:AAA+ ATPase domain-containing protein n=1 Tax=Malassezia psittaci TaxID=1821823 RepID=A0AAF0FAG4_9BASI|nr:hypothetical protein MPSI1_001349 [Malassezia psittaci]